VPVLPSDGACCNGGPELLLFGPLPSSTAVAVWTAGFGAWFERTARRLVAAAVRAGLCFGAERICGASILTGGSVGFSWACADAVAIVSIAAQESPARRWEW
jgi:hypothetical protein